MNALRTPPLSKYLLAATLVGWLAGGRTAKALEDVSFPSLDAAATEVHGVLVKPVGPGPFPAVVGMHGCGGLFNRQGKLVARESAWAETLSARGYVVLFPDSFGSRHLGGACADGGPNARPWAERSYDAYGALRYLQSLPFVIGDRIGLVGWSHGGGTVLFTVAAATETRPAELPKGDFRAAVAFYPGWCSARQLGDSWTTKIPLLLAIGDADDWTRARPCVERLQSAIDGGAPVRIKTYDGAYHDFDWPGMVVHSWTPHPDRTVHTGENAEARTDALSRVPAFLDEFLKPRGVEK
ncbi:dienelactone hydrolase family protein [Telmatospirillum sp.]|uniref:dienelactone hydrolase family protein n=1 Tax=Telmatospirillum sp. TaxID=2079197 RepID=UPI002842F613|nr:dienelactone hydrolase family protein [Telmatospirillum sp.]MDR3438324.1 dienelactone hydrolase family protein [Telmatospirillum sp.]